VKKEEEDSRVYVLVDEEARPNPERGPLNKLRPLDLYIPMFCNI
jgi:hypothetical protein